MLCNLPASCFFRIMSAAASLFRCCSVPEAVFLFFWTQLIRRVSPEAGSERLSYYRRLRLLILLPGLVSLIATCHGSDCSVLIVADEDAAVNVWG